MKKLMASSAKAANGSGACLTEKKNGCAASNVGVFTEENVLTPAMREQMEAFYGKVDADLFDSEHKAHMALCRDLAEAARKRGEVGKALKIERKAREWAKRHTAAVLAELRKEAAR